ncbi:phosphoribosyl-AMP cyclohydrolase [Marinospirillum alkaliphilum]|uniref:Phosphoribosyl-AMP cyclohydrolase n=1 Tax=Marinospirillum alkaliphilum DSM 21637 TaxID=1122209 RepID=A0A1K1XMN6_9GAMM|nr:phosphoribosyl-AMP cyclohydrolase [Marinospirillum alkaliphilum]SFX50798.1 phosphoribosyl-AMP cyclohydrolase [Marinospirillum alkaliphilum DSM 21637]
MASNNQFWLDLEQATPGTQRSLEEVLDQLAFNEQGLITAVAQQVDTGEVLMLAWMNRESLLVTLQEGRACYWSRSRNRLWRKGESSGQVQWLKGIRVDCDGDALLLLVDQQGPACHTGRRSCFYFDLNGERLEVLNAPDVDPASLYGQS